MNTVNDVLQAQQNTISELLALIEQFTIDLNQAHDELTKAQGVENPESYDWPEWTPQANSIRWAENLLGKKLAKTDNWTLFPSAAKEAK